MTFGEKIRKLRTEANLTQKDLADKLNVTYQTVSKWETDINEPDFSTLKELCKILNCSIEYLFSEEDEVVEESKEETNQVVEEEPMNETATELIISEPIKTKIGTCNDCGKELFEGDKTHHIEKRSYAGVREIVTICDDCFLKREENEKKRREELLKPKEEVKEEPKNIFQRIGSRKDRKPLIWSIILGIIAIVITLVICINNYETIGLGWTIGSPIIIGYCVLADLYCIFSDSWISEVFTNVATWSIKFPGIIFTLDWDGLKFLIIMKLIFAIIGFFVGIAVFFLALTITTALSIFTFIPLLIYNKKNYI
ncbi:MAG: helix-turn-helix transcriptional regulator [Erysipelotrichales bacterium]|nr:helix-turn-helix transcriptional regulator [Erysipelotrichales bacterium]